MNEPLQDWSELSLKAQKLQKQRDQLLNEKKYDEAFTVQSEIGLINKHMCDWIYGKLR